MQHSADDLVFRTFRPGDEAAFLRLNEDWISKNFTLEPHDHEVLSDPRTHILDPGGQICIAEVSGVPIGCCALVPIASGEFELAKMTVSEAVRGRSIGRRLLEFTLAEARRMGARRLYLESNTKAAAAVHLYEQLGFRHLPAPPQPSPYARANVFMEINL
jgi:N-acetylglutamate synthase-like GNAT family acetyltransferase